MTQTSVFNVDNFRCPHQWAEASGDSGNVHYNLRRHSHEYLQLY